MHFDFKFCIGTYNNCNIHTVYYTVIRLYIFTLISTMSTEYSIVSYAVIFMYMIENIQVKIKNKSKKKNP